MKAALELGAEEAWAFLEENVQVELGALVEAALRINDHSRLHDPVLLNRTVHRMLLAALLDRSITESELRAELFSLIVGKPLRTSQ